MVRAIAILCLGLFPLLSLPGTQAGWAFCLNNLDFCGMEAEADSCCKQASVDTCCGDHGAEDSTGCCLEANGGSVFVSGAALTVGLKRGGMLIALLILPLYVPVLIFGSAAVQAAASGSAALPHLAVLGALLCLGIALAPLATAAALRISMDA